MRVFERTTEEDSDEEGIDGEGSDGCRVDGNDDEEDKRGMESRMIASDTLRN